MYGKVMIFGAGIAVGYVLGSRQGRQAFNKLQRRAREFWEQPAVQKTMDRATDVVREKVPGGDAIVDVVEAVRDAGGAAASSGSGGSGSSGGNSSSKSGGSSGSSGSSSSSAKN